MKPKHLPASERRALTVQTVISLAAETNPDRITTAAIAQHMKLTQGALFRHFPNKEAIWQSVMEWVSEQLLARLERAAGGHDTVLGALEAMFLAHVRFVAEHPGVPRMLFGELQRSEETLAKQMARSLLARYAKRLAQLIDRGKAEGELAPEVDTATAATLFIGTIQGLVMQSLLAGQVEHICQAAPATFELYQRAIRNYP